MAFYAVVVDPGDETVAYSCDFLNSLSVFFGRFQIHLANTRSVWMCSCSAPAIPFWSIIKWILTRLITDGRRL